MALSGSSSTSFHNNRFNLIVEWSATQNINNNTSTVTAKLYMQSNGSGYGLVSSSNKPATIRIDGTSYNQNVNVNLSSGQKKLLMTKSKTISHLSNGNKTFSLAANINISPISIDNTSYSTISIASRNFTLDSIARASKPSLNFSSRNYGQSVTISTNRASTSFTHTVRYNWNGRTGNIATGVGASTSWTIPTSFMNYIPNATSATGTIYVDTFSGGKKIGTNSVKLKTNVPTSVVPSFTTITHSENVSKVNSTLGVYAKSLSRLNLAITGASGANGSTIKSYRITFNGKTYNSRTATTSLITASGNLTITGRVTDSRGRTATKSVTVNISNYNVPKITGFRVDRVNASGDLDPMGDRVKVTRSATWSSFSNNNKLKLVIKSRKAGTSTWTTKQTITGQTGGSHTTNSAFTGYDITSSYEFELEISDEFNKVISSNNIPTAIVTMSWGKIGVGFGKVWESGSIDVEGTGTNNGIHMSGGHVITNGAGEGSTWSGALVMYTNRAAGTHFLVRSRDNGSGARNDFYINQNGALYNPRAYENTTTLATNLRVADAGYFYRSTSASKYKLLIEPIKQDPYKILEIEPKSWYDKVAVERHAEELSLNINEITHEELEDGCLNRVSGLIAEDVYNAGLEEYVDYGDDGEIEGIQYDRLLTLLIPIVRDLKKELEELKR